VDDAARPPLLEALKAGEIDIVIGTHALFSTDVVYKALKYIVIDEQHRFGVMQRIALYKKGDIPDMLMMTATPIPRSLALTLFGDLAVSSIKKLPPGRKPVATHLAKQGNESKVYDFVRKVLKEGRQAYFVYPLIGESDKASLKSAEEMATQLATKIYPEFSVSLLHSKLKEDKKKIIMDDFVNGKTRILVATTIVEVGVDVPNAAIMVVEHAERFGLSALHQLRAGLAGASIKVLFLIYSGEYHDDAVRGQSPLAPPTLCLAEEGSSCAAPANCSEKGPKRSFRFHRPSATGCRLLKSARADAFAIVKEDPTFSWQTTPFIEGIWKQPTKPKARKDTHILSDGMRMESPPVNALFAFAWPPLMRIISELPIKSTIFSFLALGPRSSLTRRNFLRRYWMEGMLVSK